MANAPCPGPFDYGDLVVTRDERVGEITGYGSPPLRYTVALTFDVRTRLPVETEECGPVMLVRYPPKPPVAFVVAGRRYTAEQWKGE